MSKKEEYRIIPLTENFMKNKNIYDKVWAYFQIHSYVGNDQNGIKHRFIYNNLTDNINLYKDICNDEFCYNTFIKKYNIFMKPEEGNDFISKGKIVDLYNNIIDVHYLKEDFSLYKMIPLETLEYLFNTSNSNVIKIYTYLLNCHSFSKLKNTNYKFTLGELSLSIGYTSRCYNKTITHILEHLNSIGLISYHLERLKVSNTTTTYYHILDNVSLFRNNKTL